MDFFFNFIYIKKYFFGTNSVPSASVRATPMPWTEDPSLSPAIGTDSSGKENGGERQWQFHMTQRKPS